MGKASRATAPDKQSIEGYDGAFAKIDDYTVAFEEYSADADLAPLFVERRVLRENSAGLLEELKAGVERRVSKAQAAARPEKKG